MVRRSGFAKAMAGKRTNATIDFILSGVMESIKEEREIKKTRSLNTFGVDELSES